MNGDGRIECEVSEKEKKENADNGRKQRLEEAEIW